MENWGLQVWGLSSLGSLYGREPPSMLLHGQERSSVMASCLKSQKSVGFEPLGHLTLELERDKICKHRQALASDACPLGGRLHEIESGGCCISPRIIGQFSLKDCGIQHNPDSRMGGGWGNIFPHVEQLLTYMCTRPCYVNMTTGTKGAPESQGNGRIMGLAISKESRGSMRTCI